MSSGVSVAWNETTPAPTDPAGQGPTQFQSLKSSARNAIGAEHNFGSSGGSTVGYHLFGSARPYFGTISKCSSDGTDARLYTTSDTTEVYSLSSLGAWPIGGAYFPSIASSQNTNLAGSLPIAKAKTVFQYGIANVSSGSIGVVFGSPYSGVPIVFLTQLNQVGIVNGSILSAMAWAPGASSFTVTMNNTNGSGVFAWLSIGTVASGTP